MKKREGTIGLHDTNISIWEDVVDEKSLMSVYMTILLHLRLRGFRVIRDPFTKKHYRCISNSHHYARLGDLEATISLSGRHIEMLFFQNLSIDNKNGGRYDFDKFKRMPYLMRKRYLLEVSKLLEMLISTYGYALSKAFHEPGPIVKRIISAIEGIHPVTDPLKRFNDTWGSNRFKRDETGWPAVEEYAKCNNDKDRDGACLRNGLVRYFRDKNGYLKRGRVYTNMNNMWRVIFGPCRTDTTVRASWEFFELCETDCRHRHFSDAHRKKKIRMAMEKAVKGMEYERAAILRDLLGESPAQKAA